MLKKEKAKINHTYVLMSAMVYLGIERKETKSKCDKKIKIEKFFQFLRVKTALA